MARKTYLPRDFDARPAVGKGEARHALAEELGCDPAALVWWKHPERGTESLSLPDADGGEAWMEEAR